MSDLVPSVFGDDCGIRDFIWTHLGISLALTLHSELDTSPQGPGPSTHTLTAHSTGCRTSSEAALLSTPWLLYRL